MNEPPDGEQNERGGATIEADATGPSPTAPEAEQLVELNALLGRGTSYTGKLHFEGRIRIEGHFRGEIRGEDILVIGEGAEVEGTVRVGVCIVTGGRVRADIRASRAIELHVPAVVVGDLHAPAIFIDRGVKFEGSCKMAPLDATPPPDAPVELPRPTPPPKRGGPTTTADAAAPAAGSTERDPSPGEGARAATSGAAETGSADHPAAPRGGPAPEGTA